MRRDLLALLAHLNRQPRLDTVLQRLRNFLFEEHQIKSRRRQQRHQQRERHPQEPDAEAARHGEDQTLQHIHQTGAEETDPQRRPRGQCEHLRRHRMAGQRPQGHRNVHGKPEGLDARPR